MENINSCTLAGNLVKDATQPKAGIVNFSIACNGREKQGDEYVDAASYFDCVLYGKRGDAIRKYLTKGTKVLIQAKARQDRWQDKNTGATQSRVVFVINEIELAGVTRQSETQESPIF